MVNKVVVTAAITGAIHTPSMSPYLPITPEQIAEDAIKAYEAGAAIVHIHVRDPETGEPTSNMDLFRQVLMMIKDKCNAVVCTTTGGGHKRTIEERLEVIPTFKPELASFNAGSLNIGNFDLIEQMKIEDWKYPWEQPFLEKTEDLIFPNTFRSIKMFAQAFAESDTKPEIEIYDSAMINNVAYLIEQGYLKKPLYLQFALGILGRMPATIQNLLFLYETARRAFGDDFIWSACAAGHFQLPICTMALTMGGNVRVGMEDNLYAGKGIMAKSNAEQVEKIVRIAKELSIDIASPDEARQMLGLKGLDKVNY